MSLPGVAKTAEALVVQQIAGQPHLAVLLLKLAQVSEPEVLIHRAALEGSCAAYAVSPALAKG